LVLIKWSWNGDQPNLRPARAARPVCRQSVEETAGKQSDLHMQEARLPFAISVRIKHQPFTSSEMRPNYSEDAAPDVICVGQT
jgi:hypothetical protein